tara:strand:+ start:621 stop:1766 length:1146 start_codon:yes stop_codon:yes gene_type:complete
MQTFVEKNFGALSFADIKRKIRNEYKFIDIDNLKNCLIYGASKEAELFIKECKKENISIKGIVDDVKKGYFAGYRISNSFNIRKKANLPIIICTHRYGRVAEKLNKLKIKNFIPLGTLQVLRPDIFKCHNFYKGWIEELDQNFKKYSKLEKIFKENKSKKVWKNYMMFKYTFNPKYLNSILSFKKKVFSFTFPREPNFNISDKEIFIDGGGWTGDSVEAFLNKYRKFKKIFVYEPSYKFYRQMKNKFKKRNIILKNCGMGDKNRVSNFYNNDDDSSNFIKGDKYSKPIKVRTETIDNLNLKGENITIKMNIEGYEKSALAGAKKVIINNNTNLMICLGHTPKDLVEILSFITSLGKKYKYFLRLNDYNIAELNLYAIERKR